MTERSPKTKQFYSKKLKKVVTYTPRDLTLAEVKRKIMDILAMRDHSEKEITKKLKDRAPAEIITQAMNWAREQNWLPAPEKVQQMVVRSLGNRRKGKNAINQKLKEMGLDLVQIDPEIELEKALSAVETKFKKTLLKGLDFKSAQKEKSRVLRFLVSRGFEFSTAQKILSTYFINSKDENDYDEE